MTARRNDAGYSFLEAVIVMSLLVPIVVALFATTDLSGSVASDERVADVEFAVSRSINRMAQILRGAHVSTLRVRASAAEVSAAVEQVKAGQRIPVPAIGEWVSPVGTTGRESLQVRVARGPAELRHATTQVRCLEYVVDPDETHNGVDDDGDGLVDEGRIVLVYGNDVLDLVTGVERFSYDIDGSLLRLTLQCARRSSEGRVYRASQGCNILMRNR